MSNKQAIDVIYNMLNEIRCFDSSDDDILQVEYERGLHDGEYRTLENVLDIIKSLPDTDEWISADNPPDDSQGYVLCYVKYLNSLGTSHYMDVLSYNNGKWSKDFEENNVTHWKPLPEVPKK